MHCGIGLDTTNDEATQCAYSNAMCILMLQLSHPPRQTISVHRHMARVCCRCMLRDASQSAFIATLSIRIGCNSLNQHCHVATLSSRITHVATRQRHLVSSRITHVQRCCLLFLCHAAATLQRRCSEKRPNFKIHMRALQSQIHMPGGSKRERNRKGGFKRPETFQ